MTKQIEIGNTLPRIQYIGDGVSREFVFPFVIFKESDLEVDLGGVKQFSGYTVSGSGETNGGHITFSVPPPSGTTITLQRRLAIERTSNFQVSGELRANDLNSEFNYQTAALQQLSADIQRTVRLASFDPDASLVLPSKTERANRILGFDANGDVITASGHDGTGGVTDHGALAGLADDDHQQYHTDGRADAWLATKTTDALVEGTTNRFMRLAGSGSSTTAAKSDHHHNGTYEPAFAKNTAFNKNLGTASGTVAEGDHTHPHFGETGNPHAVTKGQVGLSNVPNLKINLAATTDPTVNDDSGAGYAIGSRWVNLMAGTEFVCTDSSIGSAAWKETTGGGGVGTASWGNISGSLNAQSDLQGALDAKADGTIVTGHLSDVSNPHRVTAAQIGLTSTDDLSEGATNKYMVLSGSGSATAAARSDHQHNGVYEPAFAKNTAFNKGFGVLPGTIAEGQRGLPAGGAPGQVLKKNTANDYDAAWQPETDGADGTDILVTRPRDAHERVTISAAQAYAPDMSQGHLKLITLTADITSLGLPVSFTDVAGGSATIVLQLKQGGGTNDYQVLAVNAAYVVTGSVELLTGADAVTTWILTTDDGGTTWTLDAGPDISAYPEKVTPVGSDWLWIADSENANKLRKAKLSALPGGDGGEANTAANVGTGTGLIYRDKVGTVLNLKSLKAGSGMSIVNNADDIILAASGGTGVSNIGTSNWQTITPAADTEVTIFDITIPANTLTANGIISALAAVTSTAGAAYPKLTFRLYLGGTKVCDTGAASAKQQLGRFKIEAWVAGAGATNAQRNMLRGEAEAGNSANQTWAGGLGGESMLAIKPSSIDMTAAQNLKLTVSSNQADSPLEILPAFVRQEV